MSFIHEEFLAFLKQIDREVDKNKQVHIILEMFTKNLPALASLRRLRQTRCTGLCGTAIAQR